MDAENGAQSHQTASSDPGRRSTAALPGQSPNQPGNSGDPKRSRFGWMPLLALGLVITILAAWGIFHGKAVPAAESNVPVVAVAQVDREDLYNEMGITAEFRPYVEVELHAKVAGYVDQMNVDFGDKVKAGQLLATLEVPELLDQLTNAQAVVKRAEADATNAELIYRREMKVNQEHPGDIPQQQLDTDMSKELSTAAELAADRADVERYQTLVKYTQITAPFDGVITKRYADPGALIQAGTASETQSMPLLRVSDNYLLRLDFPVSVKYVEDIRVGQLVDVKIGSLNGKTFTGKVTRFTDKVDDDTRRMITEIEVENPNLEIVPGMYADVTLKVQQRPGALAVPAQAVSGDTVYVINANHEIESRPVTTGLETPDKWEILSGLKEGEWVLVGPRAMVQPGEKVEPKPIGQLTMQ